MRLEIQAATLVKCLAPGPLGMPLLFLRPTRWFFATNIYFMIVMNSQLSPGARAQLDRFCRQYLQLVRDIQYPDQAYLRSEAFQACIHAELFNESVLKHAPPQRYQMRILKELMRHIEHSIQDWGEEVCTGSHGTRMANGT
jgi:hypothetical protein